MPEVRFGTPAVPIHLFVHLGSQVRGHLPRDLNLFFDGRDPGFQILASEGIGYFSHQDTRLLRGKVEQQDQETNFFFDNC